MSTHGLLLAAGAGRRMGTPKALMDDWLVRSVDALRAGGCDPVTVVLGAAAAQARGLLARVDVRIVEAADWSEGMGASLRAGLASLAEDDAGGEAALVSLVDLPDVGPEVVRRLLAAPSASGPAARRALVRAAYDGSPGHPVLLGRDHWAGVIDSARGDRGARGYLAERDVDLVECGDLASGRDVDTPTPG